MIAKGTCDSESLEHRSTTNYCYVYYYYYCEECGKVSSSVLVKRRVKVTLVLKSPWLQQQLLFLGVISRGFEASILHTLLLLLYL